MGAWGVGGEADVAGGAARAGDAAAAAAAGVGGEVSCGVRRGTEEDVDVRASGSWGKLGREDAVPMDDGGIERW